MDSKSVVTSPSTGCDDSPGSSDSNSQVASITPEGSENGLNGAEEDCAPYLNVEMDNGEESLTRDFDTNEDSTSAEEKENEVDLNGEDTIYIPVIEPPVLCVMRHSTRLDVAMHEWKMQHEGNEEEEQQRRPEYWPEWLDQHTR